MEIDITELASMDDCELQAFSASRYESGLDNIGQVTFRNALEYAEDNPLLRNETEREAVRDYFRGFGAWSTEEIDGWTNVELDALAVQHVAGFLRWGADDPLTWTDGSGRVWYYFGG